MFLRQSTSQAINFGPFLDSTDGDTEETALTIAQSDMLLSKDGGGYAQKSAAGNATHDSDGNYTTTLSTTDTNTVGELKLYVHVSGALAVWERFYVVEEAIYDKLFAASGELNDLSAAQVNAEVDTGLADYDGPTKAELDSGFAALNDLTAAQVNAEVDTALADYGPNTITPLSAAGTRTALGMAAANLDTQLAALPTAAENRAEMDSNSTQLAAIVADTNELQSDDVPGLIAALNDPTAAAIATSVLTTQMTESYAADGVAPTLAQCLFLVQQAINDFVISGTTKTVRQLDGTTPAGTFTLDDGTNPSAITRAT